MANVSRINGFKPVKKLGDDFNGKVGIYEVPAAETVKIFVGDPVILSNSDSTSGYPAVEALAASGAGAVTAGVLVGFCVGIFNSKVDPVDGGLTSGSMSGLDLPTSGSTVGSTKQFILVCDNPFAVFEAQADAAVALSSIGLNAGLTVGTHSTTTGASAWQVTGASAATTSTLPLTIVGFPKRPDNEVNATNNRVLVKINTHQYAPGGQRDVASAVTIGVLGV
jgi:hypothetical protein